MTVAVIIKYSFTDETPFAWYPSNDIPRIISGVTFNEPTKSEFIKNLYDFENALNNVKTLISREGSFEWNSYFEGRDSYIVTYWRSKEDYEQFNKTLSGTKEFEEFTRIRQKIVDELKINISYLPLVEVPEDYQILGFVTLEQLMSFPHCK